jgi:hypothetical protein
MHRYLSFFCLAAFTILFAVPVRADYFLEFKPQSPFTLGGSTTVDVVLRETRISGSTSDLGTKATIFGNFRLTWSGSAAYTVSNLLDHGIQGGRSFDNGGVSPIVDLNTASNYGTVEQLDAIPEATDPLGTIVSNIEATLRLGSFVLSGGAVGETVTFQMEDFDNVLDDIVLEDGTVLDGVINYGSMDFSVSAVPEPSSMLALGVLIGGVGLRQWRKRRTARNQTQA